MKICFFGVGGVGGYFGAIMSKLLKDIHEIYFIARGDHKDAICKNGLILKRDGGKEIINTAPVKCTDNVEELPVCDIVILSVKSYDLANASVKIASIVDSNSIVLPLLNGVDIYDRIRRNLHKGIVLQSCVYVGTHIEQPGVVYQKGGACKILAGYDPANPDFYPESLLNLLIKSGIDFSWEGKEIAKAIWSKYMFIASFGLVTTAFEKNLGQVMESSELSVKTKAIMMEIEQVARRLNVPLSSDIVEASFLKGGQFPYETKTSFQRDVESKGRVNEADLFGETLIRYGKKLNVSTTNIEEIYNRLFNRLQINPDTYKKC